MVLSPPVQDTFSVGQLLTSASMNKNVRDAVTFLANPPIAVLVQATAQSLPNATFTAVTLDSSVVDTYSGHSNSSSNTNYTAQVAGWYSVIGSVNFTGNTAGRRLARLAVNGTATLTSQAEAAVTGSMCVFTPPLVYLNAGDVLQMQAYQSSGAALSTYVSSTYLQILWVHA